MSAARQNAENLARLELQARRNVYIRQRYYVYARRSAMGMLSRMSTIVKSKMNRILDNAEDPRETLDYSYEKQLEMLRNVKRGVVEVVAAKRQIQQQADKVRENVARLERQAEQAVDAGREDLALLALERKHTAMQELEGLDQQIAGMEQEQEKLTQAEQRLSAKVSAFRSKKEVIKAQYNAAQAQVRIGSALSGISEEMSDVGLAVERAEAKTENMRARAGAIDELVNSGVLNDVVGDGKDDITRELEKMSASSGAESELAALKARRAGAQTGSLPGSLQ
jgi:phage shock protein A